MSQDVMMPGPTQAVFELVLARHVMSCGDAAGAARHPMLLHVWWRAPQQGPRLVQVYVDGELYAVTSDPQQRDLWVVTALTSARRIELLAVDAADREALERAWPRLLQSWPAAVTSVLQAAVVRDERLPVDAWMHARLDDESTHRTPLWPQDEHRGGFGVLFGYGGFGHDDATGPGLGEGQLGCGPLGSDGTAWRWRARGLPAGEHMLEARASRLDGSALSAASVIARVTELPPVAAALRWTGPNHLTWNALAQSADC